MALLPDGKIVLVGFISINFGTDNPDGVYQLPEAVRLDSNGNRDTSFGSDGELLFNVWPNGTANSVAVQADGNILVAVSNPPPPDNVSLPPQWIVARLLGSGTQGPIGGYTVTADAGASSGLQTVAMFSDPGGAEPLADYSADIDWGDGSSPTQGTISGPDANGNYTVQGSHAYATAGSYPITVTIHHDSAADATGTSTAYVLDDSSSVSIPIANSAELDAAVSAVDNLAPASTPITITLNLAPGTSYSDVQASPPAGVTLVIAGDGSTTTFVGNSPALTVTGGDVVINGVILTTATASPTILVTGGSLTLRGDTVQESAGSTQGAIALEGGTLDLGTAASPGADTINTNGTGAPVQNSTGQTLTAFGDTFEAQGTPVPSPYKATPVITWNVPAAITYGTPLGSAQLDAGASVAGTFAYSPAAGTILHAGTQTLSVAFTPSDTADYTSATATVNLTVNPAPLTVAAQNASRVYGTANPSFSVVYAGFVGTDTAAGLSGTLTFTTSASVSSAVGSYAVTPGGLTSADYAISFVPGTLSVTLPPESIFVLNSQSSGALTISGNADIAMAGELVVDSSSSSGLLASGNAGVTASGGVLVVGGVSKSGNARAAKTGTPGGTGDPLANLPEPPASGPVQSVSLSGNSTKTISAGTYSSISVSGNAGLTLNPGVYVIKGGGMTVSGNASISGNGVLIFDAGSNYPATGGSFGSITLSGNGTFNLSAATTGPYAGIVIFQSRDNTRALALGGNAQTGINGVIYAANAPLTLSGNAHVGTAQIQPTLVTGTLSLSGNSVFQLSAPTDGTAVYGPDQIRTAYGINGVGFDGTRQTIAIVDAYDNPAIYQAVDMFDNEFGTTTGGTSLFDQYGPASAFLTVLNQNGQPGNLPGVDPTGPELANWEMESALDVEWAHAMAPGANIILVEANSQSLSDLMVSVQTAASQPNVSVVSMSWGFTEGQAVLAQDEAQYDSYFTSPGVTFVASTGDYSSANLEYPAVSPNVVAVGGTSLQLNPYNSHNSESGWGSYSNAFGGFIGSGGGVSQFEAEPSYQLGVQSTGYRTIPDVSFVADPNTGAWVADPYNITSGTPFEVAGGTSLSAPSWAGLFALVNQGRNAAGLQNLNAGNRTEALQALYGLPQSDYNVISSGTNGGYNAAAGYNLVTGLGTPIAGNLVRDLIAGTVAISGGVAPISASLNANTGFSAGAAGTTANVMNIFAALTLPAGAGEDAAGLGGGLRPGGATSSPMANVPSPSLPAGPLWGTPEVVAVQATSAALPSSGFGEQTGTGLSHPDAYPISGKQDDESFAAARAAFFTNMESLSLTELEAGLDLMLGD